MFLGLGVLIFVLADFERLKLLPNAKILIASFGTLFLGWVLTILEGFFLGDASNLIEHICYFSSGALLLVWCWKSFGKKRAESNV